MRLFVRMVLTALVVAVASSTVGFAADPAPAKSELRVGISTNYPPLAFKQHGQLKGIEPEFAKRLGPALGVKVVVVETPWEELIPALREHRIDVIMSGMSITPERQQLVSFTDPYLRVGQMALIRRADEKRFRSFNISSLSLIRVGVVRATTGEQYARANLPAAKVTTFDSVDAGVGALRKGEIDTFIHDAPAIWRVTGGFDSPERELEGRFQPLTEEHLAWVVRQDDEALRARLNATVARWKADGQLNAVLDHWIRVRKMAISIKPAH